MSFDPKGSAMYPYYPNPWQLMAQQPQNMGYFQPMHPMTQPQMLQPQVMLQNPMQMMALMPQQATPQVPICPTFPVAPQLMTTQQMQQMCHPQLPMAPQQPLGNAFYPAPNSQQMAPQMPQIAPPPLENVPQPLPVATAVHPKTVDQATENFIQDDEDDFDQERYDAIKARIRKLRGALRETV